MDITGSLSEITRDSIINFLNGDSDLNPQLLIDAGYSDSDQVAQIRRSISVAIGDLDPVDEYDTTITIDNNTNLKRLLNVNQMFEFLTVDFLIDIDLNDSETIYLTTSPRDLTNVTNGWPGNIVSGTNDYNANEAIINLSAEQQTTEQDVADGSITGGLTLSGNIAGLRNAYQKNRLINSLMTFRLVVARDGNILIGPMLDGYFRIDYAEDIRDIHKQVDQIRIPFLKTYDIINKSYNVKASYATHNAAHPTDHSMRPSGSMTAAATWKS